jgi:hypothetical protein
MKTNAHLWSYLVQFFLEWEMFQTKGSQKIKTHFMLNNITPPPRNSWRLWVNVEKYGRDRRAVYDKMAHVHCMLET